jgi:hypothetical protein
MVPPPPVPGRDAYRFYRIPGAGPTNDHYRWRFRETFRIPRLYTVKAVGYISNSGKHVSEAKETRTALLLVIAAASPLHLGCAAGRRIDSRTQHVLASAEK